MEDMPRPRFPHLHRERSRHGRVTWYVRRNGGPRVRIHGEYGSTEFTQAYFAAIAGQPAHKTTKGASSGTIKWLINKYHESSAWSDLSLATRRQRDNIFENFIKNTGDWRIDDLTPDDLVTTRDARRKTPAQARNILDAIRGLYAWAKTAGHAQSNPAEGVKAPKRVAGAGFPVWTEAEIAAFEATYPVGTKERVWLAVLLYTGLRRGDAVKLGPQHVTDGIATIRTEKSQETVEVSIPILPELQRILDAGPIGKKTFICGTRGGPMTKESFGNAFSEAARAAGVEKSAHGIRKIGATRAANAGATVAELEAIFGWKGGNMASLYTKEADRRRLARAAIEKLAGPRKASPMPAPPNSVREKGEKNE